MKSERPSIATLVSQAAKRELLDAGIDPDSPAATEFLFRVAVFGLMGAQPPRPELNQLIQTDEN